MRDIIVIGASAGGIDALKILVAGLPEKFQATIFIVLHVSPHHASILPAILAKESKVPVQFAKNGTSFSSGNVYVAPPNYHLLIEKLTMQVVNGPKEHFARPAINPLFRSAAEAYGSRVIGVILTGRLDDGVAGLWEIKRRGGLAIVQKPAEAKYPSMPESALEYVNVDHVASIGDIANLLVTLTMEETEMEGSTEAFEPEGIPVGLSCPDCRGPLSSYQYGSFVEYRCLVGHAHSPLSMIAPHREAQERALWAALVAMKEGAVIARQLSDTTHDALYIDEAREKTRHAAALQLLIADLQNYCDPTEVNKQNSSE